MTAALWTSHPGGVSSPVRRAISAVETAMQRTYRRWIEHASKCDECRATGNRCSTAERVWQAYQAAQSEMRSL